MDVRSAELTKYAANAMLATKISFMNEMANIAERVGADIEHVRHGIGSDPRIGYSFIYPGAGYGGSCFPKDVQALERIAKQHGYNAQILEAVEAVNDRQKHRLFELISDHYDGNLAGKTVRRVGPGVQAQHRRHARGLQPHAARAAVGSRCESARLRSGSAPRSGAHLRRAQRPGAVRIRRATRSKEPTRWWWSPNGSSSAAPISAACRRSLTDKAIFDGRNMYEPAEVEQAGLAYYGIGRGRSVKQGAPA